MATKLFFKHLFCSIKRRPAQPIILVLVLMLAVAVCISSKDMYFLILDNNSLEEDASIGEADYKLSINSLSESRFIITDDVQQLLPEDTELCGLYGLQILAGKNNVFAYGCATTLSNVSDFFDISLDKSLTLHKSELEECVYISKYFSKKANLTVGQTIKLNILGIEKDFKVYGISEHKYIGAYDILIDTKAVLDVLGQELTSIPVFEDKLVPASSIYIKAKGHDAEIAQIVAENFPDMTFSDLSMHADNLSNIIDITNLMIIISVAFVIIVIYCCFNILSTQREEETALLKMVGARESVLRLLSSAEMLIYWIVGSGLGIALSLGVGAILIDVGDFSYCTPTVHWESLLIGLLSVLGASQFSLISFAVIEKLKAKRKKPITTDKKVKPRHVIALVLMLLTTALTLACVYTEFTLKMVLGCVAFGCLVVLIFLLGKILLEWIAKRKLVDKLLPSLRYALKNTARVETLKNTAGLIGVSLIVAFSLALLVAISIAGIDTTQSFFTGDYVVFNAGSDSDAKLIKNENVDNVYHIFKDDIYFNCDSFYFISVSDRGALSDKFFISDLPKNNDIYIPALSAKQMGIQVGDTIYVKYGSQNYEFKVAKLFNNNIDVFLFDSSYYNIPYNMMTVKGVDGVDTQEVYESIMGVLEFDSASVIPIDEILKEWTYSIGKAILCIELIAGFVGIFAIIGMTDSIVSGYRSRRDELFCYGCAGMCEKDIKKMIAKELIAMLAVGVFIFIIAVALVAFLIYEICLAFKLNIIWNFMATNWF